MIPFVDLKAQYQSIKTEIDNAVNDCITSTDFIRGKAVSDFEKAFAEYIGVEFCMGCGNGTDAIEIILKALGIGQGDEVIVPALTWIATAEAVNNVGAEPVFVDVNPLNYTIDHKKIEVKITKRTKAIIPVHLYGCPADLNEISAIAKKHKIFIVEDCAQAHGAIYKGKKIGTFGIASAFSFFPSKNLGAYGDAGAIVTNNKDLAVLVKELTNHGQLNERHKHYIIGRNSRLDNLQASILNIKLKYLDEWNKKRQKVAAFYFSRLKDNDQIVLPYAEPDKKHVYHLFVIRCMERTRLGEILTKKQISWGIHYPEALPFLDAYKYKKHIKEEFNVSAKITSEIISIPIYPEMTEDQISFICDQIEKY